MKYLYTPFDVAVYFKIENLTITEEYGVLKDLWEERNVLLGASYRKDKKKFPNLVKYELYKLDGILDCADELNLILQEIGSKFRVTKSEYEQGVIESYFKIIKLRLSYTSGISYCKIKLRNLIGSFGYKRRSSTLVEYINRTINSLGLKTYLRGWESCNIGETSLDKIIIIRLKLNLD